MTHYIFDMDGTLFQTNAVLAHALEDVFHELRQTGRWEGETPVALYQQIMGVSLPEVWQTLLPDFSAADQQAADQKFRRSIEQAVKAGHGRLYPGTVELLTRLKQAGHFVYIASNGWPSYLSAIVTTYGLEAYIDHVYSIEDIRSGDKSALVREICKTHAISSGYVVGDRLSDFKAAHTNGLLAIGCQFDFAQEQELAVADRVVNELSAVY
ncbi:nucleosidase [Exiguobacterium indicum]|uniref:Nucleosidase n=1 Tax=Exiguobacterium indicum TaxID=296995 RepID=A0A0V8GKT9_9BACL|nr:HAD hydrolase-like protein [Exiguobacterium enclense]KSU50860.1 nucleosidase [Exiguobacterium enclense]SDC12437.1 adenosylhomocysteine nucleosidase [Exiguobacterium enclense]